VAAAESARLNIGESITLGNSVNGVLPIREPKQGQNKNNRGKRPTPE
jgi:hypothetical protein